jgi:cyclopropane-fatty-acyl-phospholipid synthase
MTSQPPITADFTPVQAHYDLSDDFFALFLDPSMTYSCARFLTPEMTLAGAQRAKIDLSLGKLGLKPGHRLLDVGCGWGATARRARETYGVKVTGLTLSKNQFEHCSRLAEGDRDLDFRLEGWESFEEKVDRIVSIGAFEHFGDAKYDAFFERCRSLLPDDGVLLLHTIALARPNNSFPFLRFVHFLWTNIFPRGLVPPPERVVESARRGGFELTHLESLRPDYARTLDCWAENLQANKDRAIDLVGSKTMDIYMKYLTRCAAYFRSGEFTVIQFRLQAL